MIKVRWWQGVLLSFISFTVILFCLEIIFRCFNDLKFHSFYHHSTKSWDDAKTFLDTKVVQSSPTLGYEWKPNAHNGWLHTNSLGMCDKERQREKPQGVYRIICLGDSTTANSEYVQILEELLNSKTEKNKKVFEVWNCGVTGYNFIQYCRAIKEKWIECDPDMIIIGLCMNDFSATPIVFKEGSVLVGYFPQREILPYINPFLFKYSALYRFAIKQILFSKKAQCTNVYQHSAISIDEISNMLSSRKVKLAVAILGLTKKADKCPVPWIRNYDYAKKMANQYSVDMIDTMPLFQKENPEKFLLLDELHFNKEGSVLVAQALYEYLQAKGVLAKE